MYKIEMCSRYVMFKGDNKVMYNINFTINEMWINLLDRLKRKVGINFFYSTNFYHVYCIVKKIIIKLIESYVWQLTTSLSLFVL